MPSISLLIERASPSGIWRELSLTVEYCYMGASRGARDRWGALTDPGEPASVELLSASDEWGNEVRLTSGEAERAEALAFEDVRERECEMAEMRCEMER